jgi:hypothetical protein
MIMKTTLTLIAVALFALAGPVVANDDDRDDIELESEWDLENDVEVRGDVYVYGRVHVGSESGAAVDQDQATIANGSFGDGDNDASASGNALRGAKGNVGANIAAGVGNAQANDAAISAIDGNKVFGSAQVFNTQTTAANFGTDLPSGPDDGLFNDAVVENSVLRAGRGNIGLNVTAGAGNAQTNAMAASVNSSGNLSKASADSEQVTMFNALLAKCDLDNTASLGDNALRSALGNIGVNISAGAGNAQHNGLSISAATCGNCQTNGHGNGGCTTPDCGNTGG